MDWGDKTNHVMMQCVLDGQEGGIEMAADLLEQAKPSVDPENQTWDSAIAILRIFLAKAKEKRK